MKAVRVNETGGPSVLRLEETPDPMPGPGQVLVRVEAAGVNYIDVYQRSGLYSVPLPATLGQEGAGTVVATGATVSELRPGDRVAWAGPLGAYAERAVVPADRAVWIPEGVTASQAAAAMLQGMTAHYLATSTYPLREGDTCLVHAAAGGVGLLLCQIASRRGARVIGTVSNEIKAQIARGAGADDVIVYTQTDFAEEVRNLTSGEGVNVVYDSVGLDTFDASLECLRPRGTMVLFGQSSGPVPPFDPQVLSQKGSLYLTRPRLGHYVANSDELAQRAGDVLGWVRDGSLSLRVERELPLAEAAEAHRLLESRSTSGKLLLVP